MMDEVVRRVEQDARARYANFDVRGWQHLRGALDRLLASLAAADEADRVAWATTWLELGAAALGAGTYAAGGAQDPFAILWERLIPDGLGGVPAGARAQLLADAFNVGENLSRQEGWRRMIFVDGLLRLEAVSGLHAMLAQRAARLAAEPTAPLRDADPVVWVDLSRYDRSFLPGALVMLSPVVVAVLDRLRTDERGAPLAVAVWMPEGEAPSILGAVQELPSPAPGPVGELPWFGREAVYAAARTPHRAVASITTSQRIGVAAGR